VLLVQLREWMERADAFNEEGLFRIAGSESSLNRMMGLLATHNNNVDIIMRKSGAHVHEAATFIKVHSLSLSLVRSICDPPWRSHALLAVPTALVQITAAQAVLDPLG